MKILVVAHESEFVGGANRALFAILKYWKENADIEFEVLLPCEHGGFIDALNQMHIKYYIIKYYKVFTELKGNSKDCLRKINVYRKDFYNSCAARKIAKILSKNQYDLIYSNTRMSTIGEYIGERLHMPHVVHIREFGNENTYWGPANIKRIYRKSNKIIVISKALANQLEKDVASNKIVVSHDGVTYQGKTKKRTDCKLNILLTGRITAAKSQKEAVLALLELKKRKINNTVMLHFAGSVSSNSKYAKQYYEQLVKLIKESGLEKQVIFHGEVEEMNTLRQNMDIELMCAERETFGWVTVEGMRSGSLVIGTDTGATPEIISNMKTGLLYRQGNAVDLADKIEWVLEHKDEAEKIRKQGEEYAKINFTIEKNGLEIYKIIQESIGRHAV